MQFTEDCIQRHLVFLLQGGTLHYLPISPRTNVVFFSGRAKIGGKKKTKEKFEIYFFHVLSFFFFRKKNFGDLPPKNFQFFFSPRFMVRKKKTRPTYLYSQKSAQKQCATPEIKKLSAFGCGTIFFTIFLYFTR